MLPFTRIENPQVVMSFQAYIDSIRAKTGLSPEDFRTRAAAAGLLEPGVKATQIYDWLRTEFGLGLGHARAMHKYFKDSGWLH